MIRERRDKVMVRPGKNISLDDTIIRQEEIVTKARERYDTEVRKLKGLYARRDEQKKKALLEAVEKSNRTYKEIMAFLAVDVEG